MADYNDRRYICQRHTSAGEHADTYNHRNKVLDPQTRLVQTFAGSGRPGFSDGPAASAQFYEPGRLTTAGSHPIVADTNNHALLAIDLDTGHVTALTVRSRSSSASEP